MTDTTDKLSLQQLKDVRELCLPHTAWRLIIDELISARDHLEAERQRADDRAKENYRNKCDVDNCMETIANLEAELAALKGDQEPVAQIVISKNWPDVGRKVIDYYLEKIQHLPVGTELFTAPQKPVVLSFDAWCESKGDKPLGWVREAMKEACDAAIEATGGIVKDGE